MLRNYSMETSHCARHSTGSPLSMPARNNFPVEQLRDQTASSRILQPVAPYYLSNETLILDTALEEHNAFSIGFAKNTADYSLQLVVVSLVQHCIEIYQQKDFELT